ncbi:MAG: Unknown protein, partial [uncultured Aureispira sp.]
SLIWNYKRSAHEPNGVRSRAKRANKGSELINGVLLKKHH